MEKHIVSISGGKDSTALLILAKLERGLDVLPVFADTGHEHTETYRYLEYLDKTLGPIRTVEETRPLYVHTQPGERTFADAAAEYIADLERRGKASERQLSALSLVMPEIEMLPLKRIHQRTLQPWIDAQRGIRASGTVARTLRTVSTVLHYAAEYLRDDDEPWLKTAPPKLRSPDWGARQPRPISWEE